ncbi:sensor histidine kinase [Acidobacteriota bacterium]
MLFSWYRTYWAYSIYVFFFFTGLYFLFKWRSRKLVKEKQRLEKIVKARTKEISEKNILLEEQSEKLLEIDKVKSRFFANISHEFRTPLTLIMGFLEKMLGDPPTVEQTREIKMMLRNTRRLLGLINRLLELSKFDSGSIKLSASRQNILPFLKGILHSFDSLA